MSENKLVLTILVAAIVVAGGNFFSPSPTVNVAPGTLGAAAGPEHTERQFFRDGVTIGATSTTAIERFNCATTTFTLGALAGRNNATTSADVATTTITVSGARVNDSARTSFATTSVPDVFDSGKVTAENTVLVRFQNMQPNNIAARTSSATLEACVERTPS